MLDAMEYSQNAPSVSQAQRLKKASQERALTPEGRAHRHVGGKEA